MDYSKLKYALEDVLAGKRDHMFDDVLEYMHCMSRPRVYGVLNACVSAIEPGEGIYLEVGTYQGGSLISALRGWRALAFEDAAAGAGLVVAALRRFDEWDAHPQRAAAFRPPTGAEHPLVGAFLRPQVPALRAGRHRVPLGGHPGHDPGFQARFGRRGLADDALPGLGEFCRGPQRRHLETQPLSPA